MKLEKGKKAAAKEEFKRARGKYIMTGTKEAWIAFCDAKRLCRLLGVIV